ncbi:hypothetical protein [Desulfonatronovibrio magnus]|uniref:hypothetical protein n=1 Tax=Desulfonatronovibrio magnus TaxID=698827 RepID=UPI0005EBD14B|nr:hypothetical protein [Desulfonatronovibrio magnus]
MEWMNKLFEAGKKLEMKEDKDIKDKLRHINANLRDNLQENIEKDRFREQRTLEISRQYYLG